MALKIHLTEAEHSALPDALKPEYTKQSDGKYRLSVTAEGGWALEDVGGLRSALEKERSNASAATSKLSDFGDITPEQANGWKAKVAEYEKSPPGDGKKTEEAIAAAVAERDAKHKVEIDKLQGENKVLGSQVDKLLVDTVAQQAMGDKANSRLLLPEVRRHVKVVVTDSGERRAQVIDPATGTPRITQKAGETGPMGLDELVFGVLRNDPELKDAFRGDDKKGSGSTDSAGAEGAGGEHVISADDARDVQKYRAARERAEKAGSQLVIAE